MNRLRTWQRTNTKYGVKSVGEILCMPNIDLDVNCHTYKQVHFEGVHPVFLVGYMIGCMEVSF